MDITATHTDPTDSVLYGTLEAAIAWTHERLSHDGRPVTVEYEPDLDAWRVTYPAANVYTVYQRNGVDRSFRSAAEAHEWAVREQSRHGGTFECRNDHFDHVFSVES